MEIQLHNMLQIIITIIKLKSCIKQRKKVIDFLKVVVMSDEYATCTRLRNHDIIIGAL